MPAAWLDPSPRFGSQDPGNDHSQRIREARCPTMPNDPDKQIPAFAPSQKPTHHGPWHRAFPYARRELEAECHGPEHRCPALHRNRVRKKACSGDRSHAPGHDDQGAGTVARLRICQTVLAVERYRRKHGGTPPDTLTDVSAELPNGVPKDAFDGQPLRYRKLPTVGYTVWSVGPNRIDDGGSTASPDSKRPLDLVGIILPN